jgi:hypothetical protein
MQSSSPTFSTLSTLTVSIFSCKVIKKYNSNIHIVLLVTTKPMIKAQQAAQNQPMEAKKKISQHLN